MFTFLRLSLASLYIPRLFQYSLKFFNDVFMVKNFFLSILCDVWIRHLTNSSISFRVCLHVRVGLLNLSFANY